MKTFIKNPLHQNSVFSGKRIHNRDDKNTLLIKDKNIFSPIPSLYRELLKKK
jgi:hypothetical protein